ncbi:hypothetical protein VTP01DRAFT_7417 [Rhizomucor pusillus]|uniref:uncharacterized protein n=1 Tax=Rhizomucor pusillus TaxID=4840 RepID=UPI003743C87B
MGLLDKLRTQYELLQLKKFTTRRPEQSNFEFHDREYYEVVYRNGVYLDGKSGPDSPTLASPQQASFSSTSSTSSRWSNILKKPRGTKNRTKNSLAASQSKTSETYSFP